MSKKLTQEELLAKLQELTARMKLEIQNEVALGKSFREFKKLVKDQLIPLFTSPISDKSMLAEHLAYACKLISLKKLTIKGIKVINKVLNCFKKPNITEDEIWQMRIALEKEFDIQLASLVGNRDGIDKYLDLIDKKEGED